MAYDLIIIGAGSSAAYYLGTLRDYNLQANSHTVSILVIGKADPWSGARGYQQGTYAQNINQSQQMAAHRDGTTAPTSQVARDRKDWADKNRQIIKAVSGQDPLDAEVVKITKEVEPIPGNGADLAAQPKVFRVQTKEALKPYYARKVVIATGAGIEDDKHDYHTVPSEVTTFRAQYPDNKACMDLDVFMRDVKKDFNGNKDKKLVIVGPFAGTDAVMQAGTVGFRPENVYWFMSRFDKSGLINVMPAQNRFTSKQAEERIVPVGRNRTITVAKDGKLSVAFSLEGNDGLQAVSPLSVDYYVYAIGQVQKSALTGRQDNEEAKSFLDANLMKDLVPLYDVNQQLAEFGKDSAAYQHVTGLELKGSTSGEGMLVIGAAAYQIAAREKIDHSYLQYEFSTLRDKLVAATACFAEAANEHYPELVRSPLALQDLRKTKHMKPKLANQARVFLLGFETKLKESLLGNRPANNNSRSKAVMLVQDLLRNAKELCYYYQLRVDAAEYLYDGNGKLKEKMDVAELQTAGHKRMLPNTVGGTGGTAAPLLGSIERNVSAMNAPVPQHVSNPSDVGQGLNFLESPTVIRIFMACHYPDIPENQAETFIRKVLTVRKPKDNGFTGQEIRQFHEELRALDRAAALKKKSPKQLGNARVFLTVN